MDNGNFRKEVTIRSWYVILVPVFVALGAGVVRGQSPTYQGTYNDFTWSGYSDFATGLGLNMVGQQNFNLTQPLLEQQNEKLSSSSSRSHAGVATAHLLAPPVTGNELIGAPKMTNRAAPERRAYLERVYSMALSDYQRVEKEYGFPADDLAGATAMYLFGLYQAYTMQNLPSAYLKPLEQQMRAALSNNPDLAQANATVRRDLFEQFVVVGVMMDATTVHLLKNPNPKMQEESQKTARQHLESFLKTSPDRVKITERGLEVR